MVSRRKFIGALLGSTGLYTSEILGTTLATELAAPLVPSLIQRQPARSTAIDRLALAKRHNPVLRKLDPASPLSLGNGEFAFTADITGLQTFPSEYERTMPLCTMSQWGWHTSPLPAGLDPKALRLTPYDTHGRSVGYHTRAEGQTELFNWLRENPHRLHLGRIGLRLLTTNHSEAQVTDITDVEQTLDLWSGSITSRFNMQSVPVVVRTSVHPQLDLLAVIIESTLIEQGRLSVRLAFPYGSSEMQAADWDKPELHQTTVLQGPNNRLQFQRKLNAEHYSVIIDSEPRAGLLKEGRHAFLLNPARESARMAFVVAFERQSSRQSLPSATTTLATSADHWKRFWTDGAAIELSGSKDKRAPELERRVVLSQYLTAIQCAGSLPPQETGLTVNSWYGKFHLEMHWWHAAHFALWNRLPLFEKSLSWYESILPMARELAGSQGYAGARWPKMVGPDGRDSPSPIGPLLIWQQPHPIFYAELCYETHPDRHTLERYRSIVFESATFMASYAFFDATTKRYMLGPPVIPAQENHPANETWNPTFELAYWAFGLRIAQQWRARLGMKRNPDWDNVIAKLSPLPLREGVYLAHENCPQTFTERNHDHPSMLAAFGMLPGAGVDRETMRRTLHKVMKEWQWDKTWGWDYPLTAMTAARLGEPGIAIDALLMKTEKNRYLPNGHVWQRANLPCYLPGNGGLLYAVAMMAAGWQGAPTRHAPGFPSDGSWRVRSEKLSTSVLRQL